MQFNPGPIQPLDVEAVIGPNLEYDFAASASSTLSPLEDHDATIGAALETMGRALDDADLDTFIGQVDAAAGSHQAHAQQPDDNFDAELTAAGAERERLGALAAGLPSDNVEPEQVQFAPMDDGPAGVSVDFELLAGLPAAIDQRFGAFNARLEAIARDRPSAPAPAPAPQQPPPVEDRPPQSPPPPEPLPLPPPPDQNADDHGGITPPPDDQGGAPDDAAPPVIHIPEKFDF